MNKPTNNINEAEICRQAGIQRATTIKWYGHTWKDYQLAITKQNHYISKLEAQRDAAVAALRDCITDLNAAAGRSHEFAMRRLSAISTIAQAAIAAAEGK